MDLELRTEIGEIAKQHALDPAILLAVTEVESGGRLYARIKGCREPLIRFEGHYFYRLLTNAKRNEAIVQGLAASRAAVIRNPIRQAARWRLLERAKKIDRPAALASCSWGCGQVMGAHWRWLGFSDVEDLVAEARSSASGQVRLMMRYIVKARLLSRLSNHDWAGFARAYNGPAFRRHRYDDKLQNAYRRHAGMKRAPESPAITGTRHGGYLLRYGSVGENVRVLQENLSRLGYNLVVDGDYGPATQKMVRAFQRDNRLSVDGVFGQGSVEVMLRKLPDAA